MYQEQTFNIQKIRQNMSEVSQMDFKENLWHTLIPKKEWPIFPLRGNNECLPEQPNSRMDVSHTCWADCYLLSCTANSEGHCQVS